MDSSNKTSPELAGKPRSRQRAYKAPPALDVPDIDEDAAERKRVLNVLAQRRYRARKRQTRRQGAGSQKQQDNDGAEPIAQATPDSCNIDNATATGSETGSRGSIEEVGGVSLALDADVPDWNTLDDDILPSLLEAQVPELLPYCSPDEDAAAQSAIFPVTSDFWGFMGTTSSAPISLGEESSSLSPAGSGLADSYLLPVHELTTLRAVLRIAERLGCRERMWSLDAVSPFNKGLDTPGLDQLPEAWRPTASQILMPHHPIVDFLPWPGARDRLIAVFTLPDEARPPNAAGPLALVNFAYDLEDNAEGVRIYGGDPYDASCWEVGQVLFERWWFLFDREIVENSNKWRRLRGAPPLLLKGN